MRARVAECGYKWCK